MTNTVETKAQKARMAWVEAVKAEKSAWTTKENARKAWQAEVAMAEEAAWRVAREKKEAAKATWMVAREAWEAWQAVAKKAQ